MFNKEKFSQIIKKINDAYPTQYDFADATVNRTYLSKAINCKLETPPTPRILQKIANGSKGITTYGELMQVCGYLDDDFNKEKNKTIDTLISEKVFVDNIDMLSKFNLEKKQILEMKNILLDDDEYTYSKEIQLDNYVFNNFGKNVELYDTLIEIYKRIQLEKEKYKQNIYASNVNVVDINEHDENNILKIKYGNLSIELLNNFNKLNELGKQKANDNVKDLTKINEYTEKKTEIQNGDA